MGLPLRLKVTVGGRSSSRIVPVPVAVVIVALIGLERLTVKISFNSFRVSPLTWTMMVLVVSPGLKVRVPLVAVVVGRRGGCAVGRSVIDRDGSTADGRERDVEVAGLFPLLLPSVTDALLIASEGSGSLSRMV